MLRRSAVVSACIFVAGCQAGSKVTGKMDRSDNSTFTQQNTDNSRKELTTVIAPQVARSIQNFQSALQENDGKGFDPDKIHIVVNDTFIIPDGETPGRKNYVVLRSPARSITVKVLNANLGPNSSLMDAMMSIQLKDVGILSPMYGDGGQWMHVGDLHPVNVKRPNPSSIDFLFDISGSTGTHTGIISILSHDKPEIVREFGIDLL